MSERNEMVLADLVALRAEENPDLDVVTFERLDSTDGKVEDEIRTYADLHENGNRIAAGLLARGLDRSDRFALIMRNHPEFVETMIAASITGTVFVPIDPRTRGEKLAYTLRNAGCKGAIVGDYCLEALLEVRKQVPNLNWILVLDEHPDPSPWQPAPGVEPLREMLDRPVATVDSRLGSPSDPLQIIYTSGTTGDPKGVVFPNERFGFFGMFGALVGYRSDDRPYTGLSLTHGNAQGVTLGTSLHMGLRCVLSRKFTKSRLWAITRRLGCTTFSLLGGMATAIYAEPRRPDDADNPVRMVVSAGMPRAIWEDFESRFDLRIFEWYAAIEGGFAYKPIGEGPIGSFGKPAPILEMKIVDDEDRECSPGIVGEIVSRPVGGRAEVSYFKNEEASRKKTEGGWLRSGDMGHCDEEGWFFFDYRKGGGIRHNGDFVHPGYVEKVLADHPAVSDVFVYGVPAASGAPGEKDVVAAVVPAQETGFPVQALFAWCRERLEPNFVPGYLQVVPEIPRTATEKPLERFLLDAFAPNAPNVFTAERDT